MKSLLLSSLLLNLVLGGSAGYLWFGHADRKQADLPVAPREPAVTRTVAVAPMSWSQIESDSPLLYMDHLHAIGCPEATIRRILNLDQASSIAPGPIAPGAVPAAPGNSGSSAGEGAPQTSSRSQGTYPSMNPSSSYSLAGSSTGSMAPVGAQSAAGSAQYSTQPRPAVPLAFQEVSLPAAGSASSYGGGGGRGGSPTAAEAVAPLNEAQQAAIGGVQEEFGNQLSGTSLNPNDPVYAQQWAAAQQRADDMMRAQLGDSAFLQYQMSAAKKAAGQGK